MRLNSDPQTGERNADSIFLLILATVKYVCAKRFFFYESSNRSVFFPHTIDKLHSQKGFLHDRRRVLFLPLNGFSDVRGYRRS